MNKKSGVAKIKSWVKNTKRERAKGRFVEEIKAVLQFENKFVVNSNYLF